MSNAFDDLDKKPNAFDDISNDEQKQSIVSPTPEDKNQDNKLLSGYLGSIGLNGPSKYLADKLVDAYTASKETYPGTKDTFDITNPVGSLYEDIFHHPALSGGLVDVLSGLNGAAQGATAGFSKYATAGLKLAGNEYDYLTQDPQKEIKVQPTWSDALAQTDKDNAKLKAAAPISNIIGNVAGAIGTTVATGGAGVETLGPAAANIAKSAIYGGLQGYSQDENLSDAGTGALVGGVLGTFSSGLSALGTKIGNLHVDNIFNSVKNNVNDLASAGLNDFENAVHLNSPAALLSQKIEQARNSISEIRSLVSGAGTGAAIGAAHAKINDQDVGKGAIEGGLLGAGISKYKLLGELGETGYNIVMRGVGKLFASTPSAVVAAPAATTAATGIVTRQIVPDTVEQDENNSYNSQVRPL